VVGEINPLVALRVSTGSGGRVRGMADPTTCKHESPAIPTGNSHSIGGGDQMETYTVQGAACADCGAPGMLGADGKFKPNR
jgi:hypothetical protein